MNMQDVTSIHAAGAPVGLIQQVELGIAALDMIDLGVFGLDRRGRLCFANHTARELARAGEVLTVAAGRLRCVGNWNRACFERALERVAGARASVSLLLRGEDATRETVIVVTRACTLSSPADAPDDDAERVLVIVDQPDRRRVPEAAQLRELFGLTGAESRVARALAMGLTLEDYAAIHRIKLSTARSQLRAVLRKTTCCRQQTLIRLLVGIPAKRGQVGSLRGHGRVREAFTTCGCRTVARFDSNSSCNCSSLNGWMPPGLAHVLAMSRPVPVGSVTRAPLTSTGAVPPRRRPRNTS
ncbi:MAG: hypothetical protein RLW62_14145, partial [Gammaproteobacteria bacterium]